MNNLFLKYFSPLDKNACVYFLIISVIFFMLLLFAILGEIIYVYKNLKSLNLRTFTTGLLLIFNIFIVYFVNRLLYSMCSNSLV
jgi:hypothetical protein